MAITKPTPAFDALNYEGILRTALPIGTLIRKVESFDKKTFGWECSPEPGMFIIFKVDKENPLLISIRWHLILYSKSTLISSNIYTGSLPPDADYNPDYEFLYKLLKNYVGVANPEGIQVG